MLAVLSMMLVRGQTLGEIVRSYPKYSILKAEVPLTSPHIPELLMKMQEQYADGQVNTIDGLRIYWPGRWLHVRASQTEPIVRVICAQKAEFPFTLFESLLHPLRLLP